jgi:trimethylamine:corrinoid methyltransferase-like protein
VDEKIQILWLEKACLENTRGFGEDMITHDFEAIKWIGEMYALAGKRYNVGMQMVISPLRLDHLALETYWRLKDDPLVTSSLSLCPIPVGGMTAPYFPSGLLAQGVAESLGGLIVAQRLGCAGPDTWLSLRVDFGDMRDMTVGYSLPENVMIQVLLRDVAEHFSGFRQDVIYLNTNAKRADAFAAVDRVAYMLMLGLAGYREFCLGAGQLSMDEVFSPAQFIIDMEIGRYVQRVLDGFAWDSDSAKIAKVIAEGVAEGNFLAHDTTLDALPGVFDSLLLRRSNVGRWRTEGERSINQEAVDRARAAIAAYEFHLDGPVQAELDRTFEQACRALGVDPASQPLPK